MRVLFVAAEAAPFAKTGGLGDVIGSLPKELKKQGINVRVILPLYGDIPVHFKEKMIDKQKMAVNVTWRQKYCGIRELEHEGITYYFIDNEYYFKRPGVYGYLDDAERFAFFNRAVIEVLPHLDFKPQIIHCHDWHTGMISVFLKSQYRQYPFYKNLNTVFTIHNLKYQGVFPRSILKDVLGLEDEHFTLDGVEFYGAVNFMKGALLYSDIVTTVSHTYAEEIKTPYYGEMLNGVLCKRSNDLYGIINGIDYDIYDPANDPHIFDAYSWRAPAKKQADKAKLQEILGLPVKKDVPVIAMVSRLVAPKGLDLVAHVIEEFLQMDVQLVILGAGEERYENMFRHFAYVYPDKLSANILYDEGLAHKIYAGADALLMPSQYEPCGISQLIAMRYGCLPIVRETGGLHDTVKSYDENTGEGNGFSFTNFNAHDMLHTIGRAVSLYKDKKIWTKIVRQAMKADYSWHSSARQYSELYQRLFDARGKDAHK